jgi:hypothetical protein
MPELARATRKLTQTVVDAACFLEGGPRTQWRGCSKLRGFGLRLRPKGRRSFMGKYRFPKGPPGLRGCSVIGKTPRA